MGGLADSDRSEFVRLFVAAIYVVAFDPFEMGGGVSASKVAGSGFYPCGVMGVGPAGVLAGV